jgi:glycosyltransferase involved in cell wall biosynthesis
MPEISIIVRTKNEERWIPHCLEMIFKQDFKNFEVILVDNSSTDHTVEIAKRYPIAHVIHIKNFLPGKALNEGVKVSQGRFIVCLSAHCVPKEQNWLSTLYANFAGEPNLAGVYGRQLPVSFTNPVDMRDLLIVFGMDRRIQVKDYFFHNANSMLRRDVWDRFPFDEEVTNIEDRVWGKAVIGAGYHIIYDPDAAVYHHHGLHQGNSPHRAKGVVSIIEKVDKYALNELPNSLKPEHANIVAVVPVLGRIEYGSPSHQLFLKTISSLKKAHYVNNIYILANQQELTCDGAIWINRADIPDADVIGLDELLQQVLRVIELHRDHPEALLYVNYEYLSRPDGLFDELIFDAQYKGYDTAFPGYVDYGHYWFRAEDEQFKQTDPSMKGRADREPIFRALYGLGCVTSATLVRRGMMIGGKIGILPIKNYHYTLRMREVNEPAVAAFFCIKDTHSTPVN